MKKTIIAAFMGSLTTIALLAGGYSAFAFGFGNGTEHTGNYQSSEHMALKHASGKWGKHGGHAWKKGKHGRGTLHVLNGLDLSDEEKEAVHVQLREGTTLREILNERGITKEELKELSLASLTEKFNERFDEHFERMADKDFSVAWNHDGQETHDGQWKHWKHNEQ